jgi:hypothetical protein
VSAKISSNKEVQIKIGVQDIIAVAFGGILILISINLYNSNEIESEYLFFHLVLSGTLVFSMFDNKVTQLFKISISLIYLSVFWIVRNHLALENISLIVKTLVILLDTNLVVMISFGILLGFFSLSLILYNSTIITYSSFLVLIFCTISSLFSVQLLLNQGTPVSSWIISFFQCFLLSYIILSFLNSLLLSGALIIYNKFGLFKKQGVEDFS